MKKDFGRKSKDIQYKGYIIDKIYTYIVSLQHLIMHIAQFGILIIAVFMAIKGRVSAGAVILIINNMSKVVFPLINLSEWFPKIFSVKSLFQRMDESLKNHGNYVEAIDLDKFNHSFQFKDVSFSYGDNQVLEEVNLSFKKGEKYLLVGPSGGGKSTLLKLLRKYFNPTR